MYSLIRCIAVDDNRIVEGLLSVVQWCYMYDGGINYKQKKWNGHPADDDSASVLGALRELRF